ncbi:MAG: hypothetical protein AAGA81_24335 [Acidobacteriota bacterium]
MIRNRTPKLRTTFGLRTLGATAALVALSSTPTYADWQAAFKRGIQASEQERWGEVVEAMREAIAERPAARKRRIPIYSSKTVIYIPNAMLAIGLAKSGQCQAAWEYFTIAETQGIVQSDRERFTIMQQEKTTCRDQLIKTALDEVQPLVTQGTQIRADIDEMRRAPNARAIWDSQPALGNGFDEGKEALDRATVRMEEGVSNGDFEIVRSGVGLARTAVTELTAVKRDFNVAIKRGDSSLILAARPSIESAEAKAREVEAKKAAAGRAWTSQLTQQENDAKAKLASAKTDLETGRSRSDQAKLSSAKTKADEAIAAFDRILSTRVAAVEPERPRPAAQENRPSEQQKRAADSAVTEARQAQQALQTNLGNGSDAQQARAEEFGRQLEQLSRSISSAKNGTDAAGLVRLTNEMTQLSASMGRLEDDVLSNARTARETEAPTPATPTNQSAAPQRGGGAVPETLRSAAAAYFTGDYREALSQIGGSAFDGKARGQALLFRAAAHFALYQLSGGNDADSRDAARAAAVEMKGLDGAPTPTDKYFSPAFLEFLESAN